MSEFIQDELFGGGLDRQTRRNARNRRNDSMFLRNQFPGVGKYGIPIVSKQTLNLDCLNLIACTNTIPNDEEYFDSGVHFFLLMTMISGTFMSSRERRFRYIRSTVFAVPQIIPFMGKCNLGDNLNR